MPAVIKMQIGNNYNIPKASNTTPTVKTQAASLKGSMIGRIHTIKPGCGGCGRH